MRYVSWPWLEYFHIWGGFLLIREAVDVRRTWRQPLSAPNLFDYADGHVNAAVALMA